MLCKQGAQLEAMKVRFRPAAAHGAPGEKDVAMPSKGAEGSTLRLLQCLAEGCS